MNDATADDQSLIQSTFEDAADAVGDMVTNALHKGLALGDLGVVIERAFDGQVVTGCAMRTDIARRFGSDTRLTAEGRRVVAEAVEDAADDELPIVLLVHREGYLAVGLRRERGSFVTVS